MPEHLQLSGPLVGTLSSGLLPLAHQSTEPKTSGSGGPVLHSVCSDYHADDGYGHSYVGHQADFLGDVGGKRVSVRLYVEEVASQHNPWAGRHDVSAFGSPDGIVQVWIVGTSQSWDRYGGSFSVATDGRTGTVDATAGDGGSDPNPVRIRGSWACP